MKHAYELELKRFLGCVYTYTSSELNELIKELTEKVSHFSEHSELYELFSKELYIAQEALQIKKKTNSVKDEKSWN